MIVEHELKLQGVSFKAALEGIKPFEIRLNDRAFQKGDKILLKEVLDCGDRLSGREIKGEILYILNYMQKENYVVFSYKTTGYINCVPKAGGNNER